MYLLCGNRPQISARVCPHDTGSFAGAGTNPPDLQRILNKVLQNIKLSSPPDITICMNVRVIPRYLRLYSTVHTFSPRTSSPQPCLCFLSSSSSSERTRADKPWRYAAGHQVGCGRVRLEKWLPDERAGCLWYGRLALEVEVPGEKRVV